MNHRQWDKYADCYHDHIVSPFQKTVKNPLKTDIKKLNTKKLSVIDIGCGIGDFLPFLSEQFKTVLAIDFSRKMLDAAVKKLGFIPNISFKQHDVRKLVLLRKRFDVAVAVNSILHPSLPDIQISLKEIRSSLKPSGKLFAVFPAMEGVIHHSKLIYEAELEKTKDENKAATKTRRLAETNQYDFIRGIYKDGKEHQKFYYRFELEHLLEEAGFKNIRIKKLCYPWGSNGDYQDFPGEPELWDWYVKSRK